MSDIDIDSFFSMSARKHKAENNLSTNSYTVKAHKQNKKISQDLICQKIKKAKQTDQEAIIYIKKRLLKSKTYIQASDNKKV